MQPNDGVPYITSRMTNGVTVLGQLYKGEPVPKHYSNKAQATRARDKIGHGTVRSFWGSFFYVCFDGLPLEERKKRELA